MGWLMAMAAWLAARARTYMHTYTLSEYRVVGLQKMMRISWWKLVSGKHVFFGIGVILVSVCWRGEIWPGNARGLERMGETISTAARSTVCVVILGAQDIGRVCHGSGPSWKLSRFGRATGNNINDSNNIYQRTVPCRWSAVRCPGCDCETQQVRIRRPGILRVGRDVYGLVKKVNWPGLRVCLVKLGMKPSGRRIGLFSGRRLTRDLVPRSNLTNGTADEDRDSQDTHTRLTTVYIQTRSFGIDACIPCCTRTSQTLS